MSGKLVSKGKASLEIKKQNKETDSLHLDNVEVIMKCQQWRWAEIIRR